jgi:serine/threonine protein kinase/Flp pilus assembly protein TadD
VEAERWRQIERLFHSALRRAPQDRDALLAEACSGDAELRREVESLLAEHERGGSLLVTAAADLAADWAQHQHQLTAEQTLGHFRILSPLGKGGMGEVYLAEDLKLRRKVALKLLPSAFTEHEDRLRRFEQEARAASALNHPSIITIYEIGEAGRLHYIATEYIEGQTLRALLKQGELPLDTVLEIALQVASALTAAHAAGILHRDIKPENIMRRPDGLVKVLDFGLAKLTEQPAFSPATDAAVSAIIKTASGVVMGTINYMSPEQARGQEVDARSDIFSFGVVLYELLTGQAPFAGSTPSDVIAALLKSEPAPLGSYGREIPREMERMVMKALYKEREERYQTVEDLLVDLKKLKQELGIRAGDLAIAGTAAAAGFKWRPGTSSRISLAWAAVMVIVVMGLGSWSLWRSLFARSHPEIRSLAVLPLENLSGDPAQEYFADGMTEELISNLTQIHALDRVISRTSVMSYKGSRKSLPEIAADLKVDAVIEGTVRRSGGRVRITAKLIPAATDSPLWSREYERGLGDALKLQSDVARAIADEIRIQITPEERTRLASARNIDPKAHDAYLLGRNHLRTNEEDLRQAIEHFNRAIQLEPEYAAAYAGLSQAWTSRGTFGAKSLKETMSFARDAAVQAVKLDPQLPEAHIALGNIKTKDWDWAGAEQELTRALELDPNNAWAHQEYADLLMALERHAEAIREIDRAAQLDPLSSNIQSRYGRVLYRSRQYAEAERHLQQALVLDPDPGNSMPYWILGELYRQMGRFDEAIASFKKYQSHGGRAWSASVGIAGVYARLGKLREARRLLAESKATADPAIFSDAPIARTYALLGDKDEAFKVLFRQVEERNSVATYAKADPPLESLHSDPRWKDLLRRMNFPTE